MVFGVGLTPGHKIIDVVEYREKSLLRLIFSYLESEPFFMVREGTGTVVNCHRMPFAGQEQTLALDSDRNTFLPRYLDRYPPR